MEQRVRPPIMYRRRPNSIALSNEHVFSAIEAMIRTGNITQGTWSQAAYAQAGDGGKRRPTVQEYLCVIDGDLCASFVVDGMGIEQPYSPAPIDTHSSRQYAAYVVSQVLRLELVPVCAKRIFPSFGGQGVLMAVMNAVRLLDAVKDTSKTRMLSAELRPTALAEALVFLGLIGSGQRIVSGLHVDATGMVRTTHHYESFTYDDKSRFAIRQLLRQSGRTTVSTDFFTRLEAAIIPSATKDRLHAILSGLISEEERDQFFQTVRDIHGSRTYEGVSLSVLPL